MILYKRNLNVVIRNLLKKAHFTHCIWRGPVYMYGTGKFLFWDVDFYDITGDSWSTRELRDCPTKRNMKIIINILSKMNPKEGFTIKVKT